MAKGSGGTKGAANGNKTTASATGGQTFKERGIWNIGGYFESKSGDKTPQMISNFTFSMNYYRYNQLKDEYPEIGEFTSNEQMGRTVLKAIVNRATSASDLAKRLNSSEIGNVDWKVEKSSGDQVRISSEDPFGGTNVLYVNFKKKK